MLGVDGHSHNLNGILDGQPSDRILKLVMPLSIIDSLTPDSKVLAVGCRFETDLLYLAAYGFNPLTIRGMDMLSYSPWVDLGNMHAMPYADHSWDAVMLGWVLTYSSDPHQAAKEILRVVKPGGIIAIGITVYPSEYLADLQKNGKLMGCTSEVNCVDDVLRYFGDSVGTIYFRHDRSSQSRQGACLVIFSAKKVASSPDNSKKTEARQSTPLSSASV